MAGGDMYNEAGTEVTFAGPEGEEALDYLTSFYREGLVQEANLTGGGLPFSAGMTGYMIQIDPSYVRAAQQDNPDLVLGVTPTLEYKEQSNFGTVGSYAMFKQSTDERYEATATWLKFLTSPENTTTILSESGFFSPRASIAPEAYIDEEIFMDMAEQAPLMRSEPKNPQAREVFAAMTPEFDAAHLGTKSVREALDAAAEAANAILAS
jgi:multiple sugar transport system substrate-binding protein